MVLINVKVKTLDSRTHDFGVDEEMSVKDFKDHIAEKVQITADLQRLIYCGRVLNDDKPLKDYDVNGKCLHLVQRPPPSSGSNSSTTSSDPSSSENRRSRFRDALMPDIENLMMGSFSIPVAGNIVTPPHTTTSLNPSSTLCGNRITVARHMLQCANNIAAYLENPENGLNNENLDLLLSQQTMESTVLEVGISAVTDVDLPQQDVQNIVQAFQGAVSAAFRQNGINNITVQHNDPVSVSGSGPSTTTTSSSITIEFPPNISIIGASGESPSAEQQSQSQAEPQTPTQNARTETNNSNSATATTTTSSSGPSITSSNISSGRRQQTTSTQTLGEVVGQMRTVQSRLDPFIQQYYDILQNDPVYAEDAARENAQRVFDRVSEALHYMSHAQHAISDLMLDLNLQSPRHLCCRPILVEQSAFVSSGLSPLPPVPVGSINIGPIFARGNLNMPTQGNANSNNQSTGQNTNASTNNNNNNNANNNNNESFASSFMSAFGLAQNNQQPTSMSTQTSTSATNTASNNQQAGQQANRERYRNIIHSILSGQPNTEVHIINANISVPVPSTQSNSNNSTTTTSTTNSTTSSTNAATENASGTETTQARVDSNTLPTTSTQTRSTSRPILTSTTLPPTSIRNFRPIPANILSSFDRFLPCNSHHIRDNSSQQQQPQQNQQTQTIHIRPQRRTVSLDRNSMRQAGVRLASSNISPQAAQQSASNSVPPAVPITGRHFSGVNNITDEELNHRFSLFGIEFSLRDLDSIEPSFYNSQRDSLRAFLIDNYFSNNEINDETVSKAIHDILAELEKYLDRLSQFQHPDYDIRKSIENLIVKSLPFIINLICDDNSGEFGVRIERQLITFCENVYMILVKCIGVRDTEKFLNDIANIVMTGEVAQGSLSKFPKHIIQTFLIERRSYDLSEIQEFLIIKRPQAPAPIARNEDYTPMEVDEDAEELLMENDDSSSSNNIQTEDLLADPLPVIDRSEPWHAQFPSSWLPIITRDIARQRQKSPQQPYSDAYISGMSSKRRKILMSKKSSTNPQQMLSEDARNAIQTANKSGPSSSQGTSSSGPAIEEVVASISNDPTIQSAYRDELKSNISQRIKNDPDFDDEKYPNSSKHFK